MKLLRGLIEKFLRAVGLRLTRYRPQGRYQALDESLEMMRNAGYLPRVVIDAGANIGLWTQMAFGIFPHAKFHLIEPQPVCVERLKELVKSLPQAYLHHVAVKEPGISSVRMFGEDAGTTGAFVGQAGVHFADAKSWVVSASTFDELLANQITPQDRALLKLDLECHELTALRGATRLLLSVEVVLTEISIFDFEGWGRPIFSDYVAFFKAAGFDLYDVAALSPRPRDLRLRQADVIFVRRDSQLLADNRWA